MPYNEGLAQRIREVLSEESACVEKKMFGGIAWMLQGNMSCGVVGDDLMIRLGAQRHEEALARDHVRPMDFSGQPMKGFVYVGPAGVGSDNDLRDWIQQGIDYARSLPAK